MKRKFLKGLAMILSFSILGTNTVFAADNQKVQSFDSEKVIYFNSPLEEGFWKMNPNIDRKEIYKDKDGNTIQNPYKSESEANVFNNSDYYEYLWTKGIPIGNGRLGAVIMGGIDKEVIQVNESTVWTGSPYVDKNGEITGGSRKDGWKAYRGEDNNGNPEKIGTKEGTVSYESLNIDNTPALKVQEGNKESIKNFEKMAKDAVEYRKNLDCLVEKKFLGEPVKQKAYQSFTEVYLDFGQKNDGVSNYNKRLDMNDSLAVVEYDYEGVHYTRESFASFPDQVVATKVSAGQNGRLNFNAELHTFHEGENCNPHWRKISDNEIALTAKVQDGTKEEEVGNESKIKFEARLIVNSDDAVISVSDDCKSINISKGTNAYIYVVGATNYVDFTTLDDTKPENDCNRYSQNVGLKKYDDMKKAHIEDYKALFNKSSLTIKNGSAKDFGLIQTQERSRIPLLNGASGYSIGDGNSSLKSTFSEGDNSLATLIFNFGKYLMISGSRENGQPLNLQGIWNSTNSPSWNGKFTININTEMNYWLAQVTNLGGCEKTLLEAIKDLAKSGYVTAREQYAITDDDGVYQPGDPWVLHHNFDIWKGTQPIDNATAGVWPVGGAWLLDHVWKYYEFNEDKEYLAEFYPIMKGACKFFSEFLVVDPKTGYLVTAASVSPEHGGIQPGPSMDCQLIRNLYEITVKTRDILDDNSDKELFSKLFDQLNGTNGSAMIAPILIDENGFIEEWTRGDVSYDLQKQKSDRLPSWTLNEYKRNDDGTFVLDKDGNKVVEATYDMKYHMAVNNDSHKHCSHLWELFPGNNLSAFSTDTDKQNIFNAFRKTAEAKEKAGQGWGLAWRTNLLARCLDGEGAYDMVETLITSRLSPNMFDQHPNFQIDGNYGIANGIAEMLIQSHDSAITLLPALPEKWSCGSFKGFKAMGGFEVSTDWENGIAKNIEIKSEKGREVTLRVKSFNGKTIKNSKDNNVKYDLKESVNGFDIITFNTSANEVYTIM